MFNVCPKCGSYRADKIIDGGGPYAVCPDCGYAHPFRRLPLFLVTGASGAGKTSVCIELSGTMPETVVLESDILWRNEFCIPGGGYREYREMWLRVCKNISQGGRPVVLCGCSVPSQLENCVERRYFTTLHYLALVCDDGVLSERLKSRPIWRNSGSDEYIEEHIGFNRWLKENAGKTIPNMILFDTTVVPLASSADRVREYILRTIEREGATRYETV